MFDGVQLFIDKNGCTVSVPYMPVSKDALPNMSDKEYTIQKALGTLPTKPTFGE